MCVHAGRAFSELWAWTETTVKPDCLAGAKGSQLAEWLGLAGAREQLQEAGRKRAGGRLRVSRAGLGHHLPGNKGQVCIFFKSRQLEH